MLDYSFHTLNDKEFEILVSDLLSEVFENRVERFKPGRDLGVDGRFFQTNGEEVIIQCKHWLKTPISNLIRHLKKTELEKVKKLNPSRYIFATSLPLSRFDKIKIKENLHPYILRMDDILGCEDLNDLLKKYKDVERKHYKLWLTSVNVLESILKSGVIGRSEFRAEEIKQKSLKYVSTENHKKASEKLQNNHVVIITGPAGIGKTTLAEQICLEHQALGYQLIVIDESVKEAESIYQNEKKQIFYFDDFLGRNFLLALEKKEDSKIMNFINRINSDKKKRFVLTSRTTIINQGKSLTDIFGIGKIERNEFQLDIKSLSRYDKAQILYNHIWHSSLSESFVEELYEDRRYAKIIDHSNFNPRLIDFITDTYRLRDVKKEAYWNHISETLDYPEEIWRHTIEQQIDFECRNILIGIVLHGRALSETNLNTFVSHLRSSKLHTGTSRRPSTTMKILVGSLLNKTISSYSKRVEYDLFNPSIGDYILKNYMEDPIYISNLLYLLRTEPSISNFNSIRSSKKISDPFFKKCILYIYKKMMDDEDGTLMNPYYLSLTSLIIEFPWKIEFFKTNLKKDLADYLISDKIALRIDHLKIIDKSLRNNWISKSSSEIEKALFKSLKNQPEYYDQNELEVFSSIIGQIEESKSVNQAFKEAVLYYIQDNLNDEVINSGIFDDIYEIEDIDEYELNDFVEDWFSDFGIEPEYEDVADVCFDFDFEQLVELNIERNIPDEDDERYRPSKYSSPSKSDLSSHTDSIDELFDRD